MEGVITVRNVTPEDWETLRDIRLKALQDTPDAFGSSYAETVGYDDHVWQTWAAGGNMFFAFLADNLDDQDDPGEPVGLAGGYLEKPGEAHLVSMWVSPRARGQGAGEALIEAVAGWAAATHDADALYLWVTETNKSARRLYERCGFRPTGDRQPLPSNPELTEIAMARPL